MPTNIPTGSPDTSAESSSNVDDDHSMNNHGEMSLSHDDEDNSSTGASSSHKSRNQELDEIAKRQQHVALTRCAALLLVLAIAAGAGVATYVLTSNQSEEAISDQIEILNQEVLATSNDYYFELSEFMEDMSSSMTALALASNTSWPYYTQENFATSFGQAYLENTHASFLSWSPIVEGELNRIEWGPYSVEHAQDWLPSPLAQNIPAVIWTDSDEDAGFVMEQGKGPFTPVWEVAVPLGDGRIDPTAINYNALSHPIFKSTFDFMKMIWAPMLSPMFNVSQVYGGNAKSDDGVPTSLLMAPLFDALGDDQIKTLVGTVVAAIPWTVFYTDVLHPSQPNVYVVVEQSAACGQEMEFTIEIDGEEAHFLGMGRLIEEEYAEYATQHVNGVGGVDEDSCYFITTLYPSSQVIEYYTEKDNTAAIWTTIVVVVVLMAGCVFFSYDYAVQRRQLKTMNSAAKTNAVLASLFPTDVRDRLLGRKQDGVSVEGAEGALPTSIPMPESTTVRLKSFMADGDLAGDAAEDAEKVKKAMAGIDMHDTKPIAELFPNTTVMFADIAGFTAWSSVREPSQVFMLLETVYRAFDNIAKRRKVFKVETVGDCYVAVTGLPEPRKDHALVMAKFAKDCLEKFNELAKQLEIALGPDTGELAMRAGLHSGPVTAGVLRGDRSRFQLFGDTVNTAARVEATGMRNRVQLSTDTASLLIATGKQHWVKKRDEVVTAKGKGELHTYWLVTPGLEDAAAQSGQDPQFAHRVGLNLDELEASLPPKIQRLVGWNVEILKKLLQQVIAHRNAIANKQNFDAQLSRMEKEMNKRKMLIGEVSEIIALPKFDAQAHRNQEDPTKVKIPEPVLKELKLYVCSIAAMHRDNYFHNFEHASHVTMSVSKLLSRIIAPSEILDQGDATGNVASALHDHTFGITSDPLTQFSVVLSALIHDTDHLGVSNAQLIKEDNPLAEKHKGKSVAEQNSIVLAWEKLMDPSFLELRRVIYGTPSELERFRAIVVNNVLATDIFDKELQTIRKNRWEKAFSQSDSEHIRTSLASNEDAINRKATIVMEHLIQASDVSHTMQHWHIYRKWNERLFAEMTNAHKQGRLAFDPKAGWYQGELGFFDNYIIPLAKKLKECGVFGVSCDEYLNYALENRREWAAKGEEVVAAYIEKYCKEDATEDATEKPSSEGKK